MPPIRLGPQDLLEYDSRYRVLICRECRYAIQKSALQSHLLRHKIYREERQRLLASIAQLQLLEPDDVPLPTPDTRPIDALPVISGYCCNEPGCGNLCASSKRMRRHRTEVHGNNEPSGLSALARPVKIQTFFRGTKLRYFEVTPSPGGGLGGGLPHVFQKDDEDEDEDGKDGDEEVDQQMRDVDAATPSVSPQVPITLQPFSKSSPVNVDLQTLTYFHHFITATSLTLPNSGHVGQATQYWQTDVVGQALHQRWLMCGVLAISAYHLAMLTDDISVARAHRERSEDFANELSAGWDETTNPFVVLGAEAAGFAGEAHRAAEQLRIILRCAHLALGYRFGSGMGSPQMASDSSLQSLMTDIRAFVVSGFVDDSVYNDGGQEEPFAQAGRILKSASNDNPLSMLLNRLGTLPARMTEAFGRPESTQDVLATLSAIAALIESCAISFASDEASAAFRGMATWLTKIPDHFDYMILCYRPAALVVLSHWASSLVYRAEQCGCWFLSGWAKTILAHIAEQLPQDNPAIHSLVGNLSSE